MTPTPPPSTSSARSPLPASSHGQPPSEARLPSPLTAEAKGKRPLRPFPFPSPTRRTSSSAADLAASKQPCIAYDPPAGPASPSASSTSSEAEPTPCLICLSPIQDRTVLPACRHSLFCFHCILRWAEVKRRCPLCLSEIGPYLIHAIRSDRDFVRYYLRPKLAPVDEIVSSSGIGRQGAVATGSTVPALQSRRRPRSSTDDAAAPRSPPTEADTALARRRHIYRSGQYAHHIGSNRHTRFRPAPTPGQIARSPPTQSRLTAFVRRELSALPELDVEFLTTYTLSILKSLDLQSDETAHLLAEFLGPETACHFVHETKTFLRSGREVGEFDRCRWVRYGGGRVGGEEGRGSDTGGSGGSGGVKRKRTRTRGEIDHGWDCRLHGGSEDAVSLLREMPGDAVAAVTNAVRPDEAADSSPATQQPRGGATTLREETIQRRALLLSRLEVAKYDLNRSHDILRRPSDGAGEPSGTGTDDPRAAAEKTGTLEQTSRNDTVMEDMRSRVREARLKALLRRTREAQVG